MDYEHESRPGTLSESEASAPFTNDLGNLDAKRVIAKYGLGNVAGDGCQLSQVLNLMDWVRENVTYNGNTRGGIDSWKATVKSALPSRLWRSNIGCTSRVDTSHT